MLKFVINISCALNLVVILMLTSSLPANVHLKTPNISMSAITNSTNKLDLSTQDKFIQSLKTKYPKLSSFDHSFLSSSSLVFLNQCTPRDVSCMTYIDMLLRLADNLIDVSLKSVRQEIIDNPVSGDSFCDKFIVSLPDFPFSRDTSIAMKMKDSKLCTMMCLTINETSYIYNVKPICSITLWGYRYIIANTIHSPSSTFQPIANVSTANMLQLNLTTIGKQNEILVSNIKSSLLNDVTKSTVNISLSKGLKLHPNGSVLPSVEETVASSSIKPAVTNNIKPDSKTNRNNSNIELKKIKIDELVSNKTNIEKKVAEINSNENAPLVNAATPSIIPFIPNGKLFDGESINVPPENDEGSEDYNNEDDGPNLDNEVPSFEKSGETAVIQNNDRLEEHKLSPEVDGAFGKYTKQDENNEQLDPFTEDTDSNLFTYFMFIMVLCVLLYVVYHNKTKVLALVLEGRRGSYSGRVTGRRKHTAAYRKLDSNLEEAVTSNASGRTTQIIY